MKKILFIAFVAIITLQLKAQYVGQYEVDEGSCDFFIKDKNWPEAVKCFTELIQKDTSNLELKYKLAQGYTYSNINKAKALSLLQELELANYGADDFKELMAYAHFYNYNFDEAKQLFQNLVSASDDAEVKSKYQTLIANCDFSQKAMLNPVAVVFENLGENVNSEAPDFLPFVNPDESNVYFTTKRDGVVGNLGSSEGFKTADIYYVKHKRNKYSRARSVGSPNTFGNEFTGGNSEDGDYLVYTVNNDDIYYDLFISELGRRSYMAAEPLNHEELSKSAEQGASISNDGQQMYFSSDLEGGYGGYDVYVIQRLPTGTWGFPKNLGPAVNTPGDEKYPMIMDNGKTLYFSSNTHLGMGGMDVFKSSRLSGAKKGWSKPSNLGYPINSTYDDLNISFAANHRYAYMAKRLDDTFGDLDIYRLTFFDERDQYTLLTGRILSQDSVEVSADVTVEVLDAETGELVGSYLKNNKDGKYSAILSEGTYSIIVSGVEGFKEYEKPFKILGKNDRVDLRVLDIVLESEK